MSERTALIGRCLALEAKIERKRHTEQSFEEHYQILARTDTDVLEAMILAYEFRLTDQFEGARAPVKETV